MMENLYYYKVLKVAPGASVNEVKAAYRKLVKQYHPDMTGLRSSGNMFREIVNAYKMLVPASEPAKPEPAASQKKSGFAGESQIFRKLNHYGKILLTHRDPFMRKNAAICLGDTGKIVAYAYLRQAFQDPDQEVVLAAVRNVIKLSVLQSVSELNALFVKSARPVKLAILESINGFHQREIFADLLALGLNDSDPLVKRIAARSA